MEETGTVYVDTMGALGIHERRNALIHSGALAEHVLEICGGKPIGPLFFLFDSKDALVHSSDVLPTTLKAPGRRRWEVCVLPRNQ
jgi:hypothetical protein